MTVNLDKPSYQGSSTIMKELYDICYEYHIGPEQLHQLSGVSKSTCCRWLQGKQTPRVDELERTMHALGLHLRLEKE